MGVFQKLCGIGASVVDVFWPLIINKDGDQGPLLLTLDGPNTRPVPDPKNALTIELAKMVASGRMEPEEVEVLRYDGQDEDETEFVIDDDSDFDYSDDDSESLWCSLSTVEELTGLFLAFD